MLELLGKDQVNCVSRSRPTERNSTYTVTNIDIHSGVIHVSPPYIRKKTESNAFHLSQTSTISTGRLTKQSSDFYEDHCGLKRTNLDGDRGYVITIRMSIHPTPCHRRGILQEVRAVVCRGFEPLEDLQVVEVSEPVPTSRQVLVDVDFVGLTFLDVLIATGKYQVKFELPLIPGGEFAGRVASVGSDVVGFTPGDPVAGEIIVGALAERVVAFGDQLVPISNHVLPQVAATMLQSYSTALYALTRRTLIHKGDSVLVLGAGGGVGLASVDIATSLGADVIAVASSQEKRDLAVSLGAKATIDPGREDVKTKARELSKSGVDIVVDPIGGYLAETAFRSLCFGGRYLVIGFASGIIPAMPLNLVLLNNRELIGIDLGAVTAQDPKLAKQINLEVASGVSEHRFRPTTPEIVPLAGAGRALAALRDRRQNGKIAVGLRL